MCETKIEKPMLRLFDPKTPCELFEDASSLGVKCVTFDCLI